MDGIRPLRALKWLLARCIAAPAFVMPYLVRIFYIQALSALIHAPFKAFGWTARTLLAALQIEPEEHTPPSSSQHAPVAQEFPRTQEPVVVLFSGGTDSTCAAALLAQQAPEVHLLTFFEHATRNSPLPTHNANLLRTQFPSTRFIHSAISVDALVRFFWYEQYIHTVWRYGLLALATPGFSSLSWHVRTIHYCKTHNIRRVADGLTRELMHFPGHMDAVVELIRALYAEHGITYENPVREWETPPDRQFIDQVLVNRHEGEFSLGDVSTEARKTTGQYLYELGVFPQPNMKGSARDFSMQHDCYPFSLYNIIAFWGFLSFEPYELFCARVAALMKEKAISARALLATEPSSSMFPTENTLR